MEAVEEYNERARKLRDEGRLEESLLVARKATTVDPENANAWWQLALTIKKKDGVGAAKKQLDTVVELAPSFVPGLTELADACVAIGRHDRAIDVLYTALEVEPDNVRVLGKLAKALRRRETDEGKAQRLEVLKKLDALDALMHSEQFDLAFALAENKEYLQAAFHYEAFVKQESPSQASAFNNLSLLYAQMGRNLDALDALLKVEDLVGETDNSKRRIPPLQKELRALRERVLSKGVVYLKEDQWYKNYINPFELLNIEDPEAIKDDPKALQKAKKALFQEIELEEGKVAWVPGLHIDKSTAMTVCEQLSNPDLWQIHQALFFNEPLRAFLTRGSLEHFLIAPYPDDLYLPYLQEEAMLRFVSPLFASQYNLVLAKAIDQSDADALRCLLDGRRWVIDQDVERCFEGARRVLERLCAPLEKLAKDCQTVRFSVQDVVRTLTQGKLGHILTCLPVEFHDVHAKVWHALRELALSYLHRTHNAQEVKKILDLGKQFAAKSPALAHMQSEDDAAINKLIAEEKAHEAHLNFGAVSVAITQEGVQQGNKTIGVSDITAVRWGMTVTSNSPHTVRYRLAFKDRFGTDIDIVWTASKDQDTQKNHFKKLIDATFHYLLDQIVVNFQTRLNKEGNQRVGNLEVCSEGVYFEISGWFSTKRELCPWSSLHTDMDNGSLVLTNTQNRKAMASLPLETTDNAFVLHLLSKMKDR